MRATASSWRPRRCAMAPRRNSASGCIASVARIARQRASASARRPASKWSTAAPIFAIIVASPARGRRSAALAAMAEQVIGEHHRHHRLADRHGADADAGVVAAFGADLDLVAEAVDAPERLQDRAGWLDREAHHDVLAGRDSAQYATGIVGEERHLPVLHPHLVGVPLARQRSRSHARADLDALDGVDAHHRLGEIGIELVVDRLAQSRGNAGGVDLDDRAGARARLAHLVEEALPFFCGPGIGAEEGIGVHRPPVPARPVDRMGADLDERAADGHAVAQHLACDRAGGDARSGLARRGATAAAVIANAIFHPIGVIGVAGTELVLDRVVVLAARVLVGDQQRDRRAGGPALEHTREDLDAVALLALGGEARRSRPALVEPGLDIGFAERNARRHALDDATDRRTVAFAPGGEAEEGAEAVT